MRKRTDSFGSLGSLGSGALTAVSALVVMGASALAGVIIARELGRTDETDGFFAAYSVFIVIVLVAQAIRVAVLPALARARIDNRLGGELAGYAVALGVVALPLAIVAELAAEPIGALLTGDGSDAAQQAASDTLRLIVPAAVAQLFAGVAASGLAAMDDYATAAVGYALGGVLGITLILQRVGENGIAAVAWGMGLNAGVALVVPLAVLAYRARGTRMPASALRPSGPPIRSRLGAFVTATILPLALQLLYVICLPFAAREGVGAQTSFTYAYIGGAALVAVTASSLGLVTSVPLTRIGLEARSIVRHVVSTSWLALVVIGGAAGVVAASGAVLVENALGPAYAGDVGLEVARLIVAFGPWMAVSVGFSVAFPLVFVAGRTRSFPAFAVAGLALQLPLAWVGQTIAGLTGLALSLAVSTTLVLAALLWELDVVGATARGLSRAASAVLAMTLVAFAVPSMLFGSLIAAVLGVVTYCAIIAVLRPRGLYESWRYLRSLT